jgi:hypothetical protein
MDPARHADSRNVLESILRHIPGFKGYLEKEYRRESDELARSHLAHELQKGKEALDQLQRVLVDAAQLDLLPQCERIRNRIDTLQSRIRGAMQGYSGFFDYVRVNEQVLDEVYQHDLSLAGDVGALRHSLERLSTSPASAAAIADLLRKVDELHRQFDRRAEILEGLAGQR